MTDSPSDSHVLSSPESHTLQRPDPVMEKRLLRKLDLRILPITLLMFLFSNLDRSNIGNAYTGGMREDLHMNSSQYSIVLLVFFVGYCLIEVPGNMLLTRIRPKYYLTAIMFLWGGVAICLAACKNYAQLAGVRAVLGTCEGGYSPGVIFFMSSWYKRNEMGRRFAIYWIGSPGGGALGGILAGAIISNLDGRGGLHGWQWLFIIEGVITAGCAIFALFLLPDFPATTQWLTEEEKALCAARLRDDALGAARGEGASNGHWNDFKSVVQDWRLWCFVFLYMMATGALTITYFIPTLVQALGYKGSMIQYMTVPIYAVCIFWIPIVCFHSDYRRERGYHLAGVATVGTVSFIVLMASTNHVVQYVFLCFAAASIWCAVPIILVWVGNVISWPAEKRAISIAFTNAAGNAASIYGAFLWPSKDSPRYFSGFGTTLAFMFAMSIAAVILKYAVARWPYPVQPVSRVNGLGGGRGPMIEAKGETMTREVV